MFPSAAKLKGRKLIIDTDLGFDDARAIMLLLSAKSEQFHILAFTCVFGNTNERQCVANVARILRLCHREEIPIYSGATGPMHSSHAKAHAQHKTTAHGHDGLGDVPEMPPRVNDADYEAAVLASFSRSNAWQGWSNHGADGLNDAGQGAWPEAQQADFQSAVNEGMDGPCHGFDGLGDVPHEWPAVRESDGRAAVNGVPAHDAIIQLCAKYPHEITIVALAPLTNIALALMSNDETADMICEVHMMGGTVHGMGNVTPFAEANIYCDAVAADIVFQRLKCPVLIAPWDLCINTTPIHLDETVDYEHHLSLKSKRANFLRHVGVPLIRLMHSRNTQCVYIDEISAGCLIDPSLILETRAFGSIDVQACECDRKRGLMTLHDAQNGEDANFVFIVKYDARKLNTMMDEAVMVE